MKLSVSGWHGAGSSTLAIILAKTLNLKLLRGGEVFRYLGKNLKFEDTGKDRYLADQLIEKDFGYIYDKLIDFVIKSEEFDNIMIESDIAAFRVGKLENYFSIFLHPNSAERKNRLSVDMRKEDIDELEKRDEVNRDFYKEMHGVDWMDLDQINEKHALPIENSNVSISDELIMVYKKLTQDGFLNKQDALVHINNAEAEEKNYFEKGKDWYLEELKKNDQLYTSDDILKMIRENFGEEVGKLPKELRRLI
jgi:cytidylate kinase